MKLGYWTTDSGHPLRTHILRGLEAGHEAKLDWPICGHDHHNHITGREPNSTLFPGKLPQVECRRCLVVYRARLRREIKATERRIAGKDGIQRDAFD